MHLVLRTSRAHQTCDDGLPDDAARGGYLPPHVLAPSLQRRPAVRTCATTPIRKPSSRTGREPGLTTTATSHHSATRRAFSAGAHIQHASARLPVRRTRHAPAAPDDRGANNRALLPGFTAVGDALDGGIHLCIRQACRRRQAATAAQEQGGDALSHPNFAAFTAVFCRLCCTRTRTHAAQALCSFAPRELASHCSSRGSERWSGVHAHRRGANEA
mmetsp:Transcript_20277/g.52073  ORF Transcript_20277/g.52073 Transcript_20277/m.52073 type:complete len:216 (+) Transcript_20277:969-1616(+)